MIPEFVTSLPALVKWPLSLLTTLSGLTGYVLAAHELNGGLVWLGGGVLALAGGSAALNQHQERRWDAMMERTRRRPLPSGRVTDPQALWTAWILIVLGLVTLGLGFPSATALLGAFAVVWYNGVYTPLKRRTAFAAVPGALTGAVPPIMGWIAGGGFFSPLPVALALFFFIWQTPHFWLLLGIYGDDFRKGGFPTLSGVFSPAQMGRIIYTWVLAAACAGLLTPIFSPVRHLLSFFFLASGAIALGAAAAPLLKTGTAPARIWRRAFIHINLFALLLMTVLLVNHGISK